MIWLGLAFIVLGLNAFISFNIPTTSTSFYVGLVSMFSGMFLIVIGVCYVIVEFKPI